jgi:hypothetical protein
MRTYFVICESQVSTGGLYQALGTATLRSNCTGKPAQILVARPGQAMARIVAEAEDSTVRWIVGGRYVSIKTLKRLISNDA